MKKSLLKPILTAAFAAALLSSPAGHAHSAEAPIPGLVSEGRYAEAAKLCQDGLSSYDSRDIYDNLWTVFEKSGKLKISDISKYYKTVPIKMIESNMQPLFGLISYLMEHKNYGEAAELLDRIKQVSTENGFFKSVAHAVYANSGRVGEAVSLIEKQMSQNTDPVEIKELKIKLADVYLIAKDNARAQKIIGEEMKKFPEDASLKNMMLAAMRQTRDRSESLTASMTELQKNPEDETALGNLFADSMMSGNFGPALAHVDKLLKEKPEDPDVNMMAAELNLISSNYETAAVIIEKLVSRAPDEPKPAFLKGRLLFDTGRYEPAMQHFLNCVDRFGDSVEIKTYYYLSLSCIKTQNIATALKYAEFSLQKSPLNARLLIRELDDALYSGGLFKAGIQFYEGLLNAHRDDPHILSKLGSFHYYAGDIAAALKHLERANELAPDSIPNNYMLGLAYAENGDAKKAIECFKKCADPSAAKIGEAFKNDSNDSVIVIWPMAHHYFCHIHSCLRIGEFKKAGLGLKETLNFFFSLNPDLAGRNRPLTYQPKSIDDIKNLKRLSEFEPKTRPEYMISKSFKFFRANFMNAEFIKRLESAPEPAAIVKRYLKNPQVRIAYDKSLELQMKGEFESALDAMIEAIKIEPDNEFLLVRAIAVGLKAKSSRISPLALKLIFNENKDKAGKTEEETFISAYVKCVKIGAAAGFATQFNMLPAGAEEYVRKFLPDVKTLVDEFAKDVDTLKNSKFKNFNAFLNMTLEFYKGDSGKNLDDKRKALTSYLDSDPDLSSFIWLLYNVVVVIDEVR